MTPEQSAKIRVTIEWFIMAICLACCIFGIIARFSWLDSPTNMTFDEYHYVRNAVAISKGDYFFNDHPAFGKLLIGLGILWKGDVGEGWRIAPAITGTLCVFLAGVLTYQISHSLFAALLASALISLDPSFLAYSRTAHMDGMMVTFSVLGIVLAMFGHSRSVFWVIAAGLAVGLSGAMKYNGLWALAPIIFLLIRKQKYLGIVFVLLACLSAYIYSATLNERAMNRSDPIASAIDWQTRSIEFHTSTMSPHSFSTRWYTWPLMIRPILISFDGMQNPKHTIIAMGNPLLVWGSTLFALFSFSILLRRFFLGLPLLRRENTTSVWVGAAFAFFPWALVSRPQFFYHYMPVLFLLTVLVAAKIKETIPRRPIVGGLIACVLLGGGIFFSPIALSWDLTREEMQNRAWIKCWTEYCPYVR